MVCWCHLGVLDVVGGTLGHRVVELIRRARRRTMFGGFVVVAEEHHARSLLLHIDGRFAHPFIISATPDPTLPSNWYHSGLYDQAYARIFASRLVFTCLA